MPKNKTKSKKTIGERLRNYFFAGVLVVAPIGVTLYIAWSVINYVDSSIAPLLTNPFGRDSELQKIPGLGLIVLVVGLTLIGAITANIAGGLLVKFSDFVFTRTPVLSGLYNLLKQMFEMLFGEDKTAYQRAVLVPYPSEDTWVMGFITGDGKGYVQQQMKQELISVFVPLTPNPTAGFLFFYPKEKVKMLDIAVEDAWKLIISTGVVQPNNQPDRK